MGNKTSTNQTLDLPIYELPIAMHTPEKRVCFVLWEAHLFFYILFFV